MEKLREMREEKKEKDLKIAKDRKEKKEEEEKEKDQQKGSDETEETKDKSVAGEKIEKRGIFTHKKEEGIFRHRKLTNFNTKGIYKINKAFKKVHGISVAKKRKFVELLKSYNPSKTTLRKKDFDDFSRRFKSKRFTGPNFSRMKKEGIDLKSAREGFKKRDLNKLKRNMIGEKDLYKYQTKFSSQKGSNSRTK